MTVEEWGVKLSEDIVSRPDFYFARHEIPRLDQDINEYQSELWDIQLAIREAQRTGRWYRTVSKDTCQYCEFFEPCSTNHDLSTSIPMGFELVKDIHPELERQDEQRSATETAASSSAATTTETGERRELATI